MICLLINVASNTWYDIKRIKGIRPQPRYRHSAVEINNKMIIFGGVDVEQQRYFPRIMILVGSMTFSAMIQRSTHGK
jgi:hypothetical protein